MGWRKFVVWVRMCCVRRVEEGGMPSQALTVAGCLELPVTGG